MAYISSTNTFRYAKQVDAKHHLVSAKLNRGIEELFLELTQLMLQKAEEQSKAKDALHRGGSLKRNVLIVHDDDEEGNTSHNRRKCCGGPTH